MKKADIIKNIYTIIVLLLIVVVLSIVPKLKKQQEESTPSGDQTTIRVTGTFSCVTPGGVVYDGCIPGIVSKDGAQYILNTNNVSLTDDRIGIESTVLVEGTFVPLRVFGNTAFLTTKTDGVIDVTSVTFVH